MGARSTHLNLLLEVGSEPIAGHLAVDANPAERFHGWIELVELIEAARSPVPGGTGLAPVEPPR